MSGAFFHFWLAERRDVAAMQLDQNGNPTRLVSGQPVYLPLGTINRQLVQAGSTYNGPALQGEYSIMTLFARTGRITTSQGTSFDNPLSPANGSTYNPNYPFLAVEQGRP
jgi:hypothetical protein